MSIDTNLKLSVVTNITVEPYFIPAIKEIFGGKITVDIIPISEYMDDKQRHRVSIADIIVVWLNIESICDNKYNRLFSDDSVVVNETVEHLNTACRNLALELRKHSNATMVWLLFEDYYMNFPVVFGHTPIFSGLIDRINTNILDELIGIENIVFLDLKRVIAEIGVSNSFSNKNKYRWNAPYSKSVVLGIANEIYKQYLIANCQTKKCLILDCDNVLWGGTIADDGIENVVLGGVSLGREFQDFQRFVLNLYNHGVILAICSKNNHDDILHMFNSHDEMIIKEEHIACFQVNWESKVNNIKYISQVLNIGLDSIVFVDDSDFEIKLIEHTLPEVTAIKYERDVVYQKLSCFNLKTLIDHKSVALRNYTFKTDALRNTLKESSDSFDDYLKSLNMVIDIHPTLPSEISRVSELTQRTNKCTNGKRYTILELKEKIASNNYHLFSVNVSDKFSDLGLVGVIGFENNTLDVFALSCRALGRDIEKIMIDHIKKHNVTKYAKEDTKKNLDLINLLTESVGEQI